MTRRILIVALLFLASCSSVHHAVPTTQPARKATVVWISIDGLRGDYVGRIQPKGLKWLASEGAYSTRVKPIFPSLTFPNHIAQVTGGGVDLHGVPGNSFYDSATGQTYNFSNDSSLLRSEPIWVTAKRQGIRTAVMGWPMSYEQKGEHKADYFDPAFDKDEKDADRLDRVINQLKTDTTRPPLRLVITYVSAVDSAGHKFGPDSAEVATALKKLDDSIDHFVTAVTAWFTLTHGPDEDLYVLITTDHGMEPVTTQVNLERLVGGDVLKGAKTAGGGPIGCITLAADQKSHAADLVTKLRTNPYVSAWLSKDVPAGYHFADPTRVGDVVVLLAPGYTFTSNRAAATMPATAGSKGMHGYDPAACPNMLGGAIVWKMGDSLGGRDLGAIDNTQWHATVAKLLGIQPAPGADPRAISLK